MRSFRILTFFVFNYYFNPNFVLGWECIKIQSTELADGVIWETQNCTLSGKKSDPLLVVNSISVDLHSTKVRVSPAIADPASQLQPLNEMAAFAKKQNKKVIAGINGGYFWRVDTDGWWRDNVCHGKTRSDALQPVSSTNFNYGIGDGLVKVDGVVYSNNCNCSGYSRPAVLVIDGDQSRIDVLHKGETVPVEDMNAIAAGPNLVSYNATTGIHIFCPYISHTAHHIPHTTPFDNTLSYPQEKATETSPKTTIT